MKRLLSLLLCFTMAVSMVPSAAFAADTPVYTSYEINIDSSEMEQLADAGLLFDGYVDRQFFGPVSFFGTNAREYLTAVEQSVYDKLKEFITYVASHGGSTETVFRPADFTGLVYSWPSGTDVLAEFEAQVNMTDVWTALVHDCPYELYWFDKNREGAMLGFTTGDDGTTVTITQVTVVLPVSVNWRSTPGLTTTMTTDVSRVNLAVKNAKYIADKYASADDYTKLDGFKNEICNIVSYNENEIVGGSFYVDNSSWQMINVFDGDHETNTVSAGYAKAFQYLCDLSTFTSAQCYTIEGFADDREYMWNIVTMEDGKTYLADVASCDEDMPGQYGQYWMAGYDDGGRWSAFVVNGRRYAYHSNNNLFDVELLILADKDYLYVPQGTAHYGQCGDNAYWFLDENGTLTIDGWGDIWSEFYTEDGQTAYAPWYYHRENVKVIDIQPGITSIPVQCFYMCQYATSATIPDTVTSVGEMAFYSCMELQELTIPDSVTHIDTAAFGNLKSIKKLTISKNITTIPDWAFAYCYQLEELVIPDGVTSIGEYGFYTCNNLTRVTVPSSVVSVGDYAFYAYPDYNIEEVYFKGSEAQWNSIATGQYNENLTGAYVHYEYDQNAVFTITAGQCKNGRVSVDKTSAQYGETVTVTATPDEHYQRVRIFVNDAEISGNTFTVRGNSTVTAQFIPVAEEVLAYGTCGDNVEWLLSSDNVLTISGSGKMTDYASSDAVPWAEYMPVIEQVVIRPGVTSIGKYAFNSLVSLTDVSVPETVTTVEAYAFYGCTSLETITLPDSITSMWGYTFQGCSSLKQITLPAKVSAVDFSMFKDCVNLETVVLPDSVNSIEFQAFSGCTSLKNIQLPQHGIFISKNAFSGCTSLESIRVYSDAEYRSFIDENAFYGCTALKTATVDARYISNNAFGNCTALEEVIIDTEYSLLEKICQSAFAGCGALKTVHIPGTVKTVENSAFSGCTSLTDVYYGGSEAGWKAVVIESNNDPLKNANIIYDATVHAIAVTNPVNGLVKPDRLSGATGEVVTVTTVPDAGYRLKYIVVDGKRIYSNSFTITGPHTLTAVFEKTTSASSRYPAIPDEPDRSYVPQYTYTIDVYRLYNVKTAEHYYTRDAAERDRMVADGWNYEGVAFKAPGDDGVPVYRLYSPVSRYHHYTYSKAEIHDMIDDGWIFKGFAWYSARNAEAAVPIYRLFSRHLHIGVHHYTASAEERDIIVKEGWRYEGTAWYGVNPHYAPEKPDVPVVTPAPTQQPTPRPTPEVTPTPEPTPAPGTTPGVTPDGPSYTYTVPAYHFDNLVTGEQFYTKNEAERDVIMNTSGWAYKGVDFYLPGDAGEKVYRLLNPNTHYHHYTASQREIDALVAGGWIYEGFVWYSAKNMPDAIPAYRLFNQGASYGTHLYTVDAGVRESLENKGWRYEGVGWYGLPKP